MRANALIWRISNGLHRNFSNKRMPGNCVTTPWNALRLALRHWLSLVQWGVSIGPEFSRRVLAPFLRSGRVEIAAQGSAEFFAANAGPPPSLVFIDGDHSYAAVHRDIAGAQRIGAAVIGGHDYAPTIPGVVQAVEEHFPGATLRRDSAWMWGPLIQTNG